MAKSASSVRTSSAAPVTEALVVKALPTGEISLAVMGERGLKSRHISHTLDEAAQWFTRWCREQQEKVK